MPLPAGIGIVPACGAVLPECRGSALTAAVGSAAAHAAEWRREATRLVRDTLRVSCPSAIASVESGSTARRISWRTLRGILPNA